MLLHVPDEPVSEAAVHGEVIRLTQNRALAIEQTDLDYIQINFQARLHFGDIGIVIECPFVLTVDNVVHRLDPEERAGLGPLLALYPGSLSAAYVSERASLHLTFESGATIVVPQHAQYEAWQVHDDKGWLLVCTPGTSGDLAEWTNK